MVCTIRTMEASQLWLHMQSFMLMGRRARDWLHPFCADSPKYRSLKRFHGSRYPIVLLVWLTKFNIFQNGLCSKREFYQNHTCSTSNYTCPGPLGNAICLAQRFMPTWACFLLWYNEVTYSSWSYYRPNSLAPGRCGCDLKSVIFKRISKIDILRISCKIALGWMPQDLTDDKSILIQVMVWCCQTTSHYLN